MEEILLKKWLVVQIKPNSYDLAIRNLERQGIETFIPKMKTTVRKDKKFIYKDVSVFPGYLFVCFNPQNANWSKINNTYGVAKVLLFNEKPYEISNYLILALKNRYETQTSKEKTENLEEGETIKFNSGPFVDLIAKVESVDKQDRIWLILDVMGASRKVKIKQNEQVKFLKL